MIGVHRGQTVQQIDLFPVSRRVPQNAQGVQGCDCFLGLWRVIHTLRLIDNNNGMGVLDVPHGAVAIQPILGLIDDVLCLFECIDVDDHNLDVSACSKLAHIGQLSGVVDKVSAGHIVILQSEMLLGNLKGLVNTFPDSHRWNDDDKLGKTVLPI